MGGKRCVLRRYHLRATREDLHYEHAVLKHLAAVGWVVPEALSPLVRYEDRRYCLTRFVAGRARVSETTKERRQRGADLARLHLALRPIAARLGQRRGWRAQHTSTNVHADVDWDAGVDALSAVHPELADWAGLAADAVRVELASIGAAELPVTTIHGDFAEWNVHYGGTRLAGVVDFGLTHLDSRPYERPARGGRMVTDALPAAPVVGYRTHAANVPSVAIADRSGSYSEENLVAHLTEGMVT